MSYGNAQAMMPSQEETGLLLEMFNQQRYAEAAIRARQMAERYPQNSLGWQILGISCMQMGRYAEALLPMQQAAALLPQHAATHYNLGNLLHDVGRLEDAVNSYRRATQAKPDFAEAYDNLGDTLKKLGRDREALESYREGQRVKGDWKESLRRLTSPVLVLDGLNLSSRIEVGAGRTCQTPAPQAVQFPASVAPVQARKLRIALIYPPPWQIPAPGEMPTGMPFGPSRDARDLVLDEDFKTITYGLLTLAAEAKRAGHDVTLHNLAVTPWREVVELIRGMPADVYGISSFTANRRGMGAMAELIRQLHPQAHIVAGGPFVTALPEYTLRYYRDIDTAVIGEGESTFMEMLERVGTDRPATGLAGTAWREGGEVKFGPSRPRVADLDALASPFDYFTSDIVMTSRGCPEKCTFCGSITTWGKKLRFTSVESTLGLFEQGLSRLPVRFMAVKDDTFTASRKRTLAICDAIIERKMNFLWSCDTRVDSLDEELLYKMRLAGCQMISLGIESGSPEILEAIKKNTDTSRGLEATRAARKYGINVRYYMMLGNRGESPETVRQSVEMVKAGRPAYYTFSALSFYPGTEDWEMLREREGLTPDIFFTNDVNNLEIATGRNKEMKHVLLQIKCDVGELEGFDYTVEEREAVAGLLPDLHVAHLELANAYLSAGRLEEAERALVRSEELGFPIPGMIANQRACIALARGDAVKAQAILERAAQAYPHGIIMGNLAKLRRWQEAGGVGRPPMLSDSVLALNFRTASDDRSI